MGVIAVPVKPLHRAKGRLAALLSPPERAALALTMLDDVVEACLEQVEWEVWVVSCDEVALEAAAAAGARPVPENAGSLLGAVRQVEQELRDPSDELAVVLGDLPLLTAGTLLPALTPTAPVVAAPATSDAGTNVLVRRPPAAIPARFGPSSFAKHRSAARRAGLEFAEVSSLELGFDLDRPGDVVRILSEPASTRTRRVCIEMGLGERVRVRA